MEHPHIVSRTGTGLLVIDMQEKFAPAVTDFDEIVQNVVRLTLAFQMFDMPVIVTEQYPQGLGNTVDLIRKQFSLLEIVEKMHFSCTEDTHFWNQMGKINVESLVVCGVESHVCISQSVLGLLQRGVRVHVVKDAIGSRNPLDGEVAYDKMIQAGAIPATTEMVLFELAQKAGTQSFKNIQRMVKRKLKPRDETVAESAVQPSQSEPATAAAADVPAAEPGDSNEEWEAHPASTEGDESFDDALAAGLVDTPVAEGETQEQNTRAESTEPSGEQVPAEESSPPEDTAQETEQESGETQPAADDTGDEAGEDEAPAPGEPGGEGDEATEEESPAGEVPDMEQTGLEPEADGGSDEGSPEQAGGDGEAESSENGAETDEPSLDDQLADILNDGIGDEDAGEESSGEKKEE